MIKLVTLAMIAISCFGQSTGANVVSTVVIPTGTVTTANTPLVCSTSSCVGAPLPIQNIGQTNHSVLVTVTAIHFTASRISYTCVMQGSTDNVNWRNAGTPVVVFLTPLTTPVPFPISNACYGYGSFPYLRTLITPNIVTTGNSITWGVTYQGNSVPSNSINDSFGSQMGLTNLTGQLDNTGEIAVLVSPPSIGGAVLYGLMLWSDNTGTFISFGCNTSGASMPAVSFLVRNLGVTQTQIFGPSSRPLLTCPYGEGIFYQEDGTAVIYFTAIYRIE